jgi:HEAT repeat protein
MRLEYAFSQTRVIDIGSSKRTSGAVSSNARSSVATATIFQDGDFIVQVYTQFPTGDWLIGARFRNAKLITSTATTNATSEAINAAMGSEVLAVVSTRGQLKKLVAPTDATDELINQWRDILSRYQTVLSPNPKARKWRCIEEDPTGKYSAAYGVNNLAPSMLEKRNAGYQNRGTTSQTNLLNRITVEAIATIHFDGYPTRIEGREKLSVRTPEVGTDITSHSEFSFHLTQMSVAPNAEAAAAALERFSNARKGFFLTYTPHPTPATVNVSNTAIQEQLAALENILVSPGGESSPQEIIVLQKIVAQIKQDDAAVPAIVDCVAGHLSQPGNPTVGALLGMLGASGTPAAQNALLGIATSPDWPFSARELALFAFPQATQPVPQADAVLEQLASDPDLGNTALLVLGAVGDHVRDSDPDRLAAISQFVLGAASAATDPNQIIVGLNSIKNLGPAEVPPVVQIALGSVNDLIRQNAVNALLRVGNTDAAEGLAAKELQNDPTANVRAAAVNVVAAQGAGNDNATTLLSNTALQDPDESVRVAAVIALGTLLGTNPGAAQTLSQVAAHDSNAQVSAAAAKVLAYNGITPAVTTP